MAHRGQDSPRKTKVESSQNQNTQRTKLLATTTHQETSIMRFSASTFLLIALGASQTQNILAKRVRSTDQEISNSQSGFVSQATPSSLNGPVASKDSSCGLVSTRQKIDSLLALKSNAQNCADNLGRVGQAAKLAEEFYGVRRKVAKISANILQLIDKIDDAVTTFRTDVIPKVGTLIKNTNNALQKTKPVIQLLSNDDVQSQTDMENHFKKVKEVFNNASAMVEESVKPMDEIHDAFTILTTTSVKYDCCHSDKIATAVTVVGSITAPVDEAYEQCANALDTVIDLVFPDIDLVFLDDIESTLSEMLDWIENAMSDVLAKADYHMCCSRILSSVTNLIGDVASLATCWAESAVDATFSEALDVTFPMLEEYIDVMNDLAGDHNQFIDDIVRSLEQVSKVPVFAAHDGPSFESLDSCTFEIPIPANIISFSMVNLEINFDGRVELIEIDDIADGEFNLAAIWSAIVDGCHEAYNDLTTNDEGNCCPAARLELDKAPYGEENGEECLYPSDCKSGTQCVTVELVGEGFRRCTDGSIGSYCGNHNHCNGNTKCVPEGVNQGSFCSSGLVGSRCTAITGCAAGNYCRSKTCYAGSIGDPCGIHRDCDSGICNPQYGSICKAGRSGEKCGGQSDCDRANGYYCNRGVCYGGKNGERCGVHRDCDSGICSVTLGSICSAGGDGSACTWPLLECRSGYKCRKNRCQKK